MRTGFRNIWQYVKARFEALVWIFGLLLMAIMSPTDAHSSFCPIKATGLGFCPGCGLGHSISWLFRGEFLESFHAHPLGIVALVILSWRIVTLLRRPVFINNQ